MTLYFLRLSRVKNCCVKRAVKSLRPKCPVCWEYPRRIDVMQNPMRLWVRACGRCQLSHCIEAAACEEQIVSGVLQTSVLKTSSHTPLALTVGQAADFVHCAYIVRLNWIWHNVEPGIYIAAKLILLRLSLVYFVHHVRTHSQKSLEQGKCGAWFMHWSKKQFLSNLVFKKWFGSSNKKCLLVWREFWLSECQA